MKRLKSIIILICFSISLSSCKSSTPLPISEMSGGMIINDYGAYIYNFKVDDSQTPTQVKRSDNSTSEFLFLPYSCTYDDNIVFGVDADNKQNLYKCMFTSADTVDSQIWISTEQLENSCIGKPFADISKLQAEGDYIYFIINGSPEFRASELDDLYRLGRISKDGKTIEFLNNIRATSYAINDGWIYYYDNGYISDNNFDYSRTGIYKCKLDGSDITLLKNNVHSSKHYEYNTIYFYNNKIYFVDCSEQSNCKVARMDADGKNIEYITNEPVYDYQIDPNKNCLYYFCQPQGEGYGKVTVNAWKISSISLDSKEEAIIFDNWNLSYKYLYSYNNYLYFSSDKRENIGRLNIETKEYEKLSVINNSSGNYDSDGFYNNNGSESLRWEKQNLDN